MQYLIPAKMTGSQNKLSSPPTPFETRGRNVTVCPANIYCYHSDTFSFSEMLSASLCKYTDNRSQHSRTKYYLINMT
jgi:hypothetical protein